MRLHAPIPETYRVINPVTELRKNRFSEVSDLKSNIDHGIETLEAARKYQLSATGARMFGDDVAAVN